MSERIKQEDGTYITRFNLPLELRQLSEKIKGTDRTLAEWWDYIYKKTAYVDGDEHVDKDVASMQRALNKALSHGGNHIDDFGYYAGAFFKAALIDCMNDSMESGYTQKGVIERLDTKIKSLAGSLQNIKSKPSAPGRYALGQCLLFYIEKHHDLPRNRKELALFSESVLRKGIAERTISKHIAWYDLDEICGRGK